MTSHFKPPGEGRLDRMTSWVGAHVDRIATRGMRRLFLSDGIPVSSVEELERRLNALAPFCDPELYQNPDRLLGPCENPPSPHIVKQRRLKRGGSYTHYRFPSPYTPVSPHYTREYARYDRVGTVHFYAWRHRDPAPASLLLLHGWGVGQRRVHEFEFGIPGLFSKLGLDVYFYVSPFHGLRTPSRAPFSGALHPSPNLLRTNESFVQTCQETRTILGYIEAHNSAPIGVMGSSLGGYTSALLASIDERVRFAIPIMPPASLADLFWDSGDGDPQRDAVEALGMSAEKFRRAWALHSPLTYAPRVPWERRLIISAMGDAIVPEAQVEQLWKHWDCPTHVRFAGGHILQFGRKQYHRAVQRFLRERGILP